MDKYIHIDEFRLRILLTNQCNKNCGFCLNDFQLKQPALFADVYNVIDCLKAYGSFMKDKAIVTFSGGEPGIYPHLKTCLEHAKRYCKTVKVVTNGAALDQAYVPYVDFWHIGVTEKDHSIIEFLKYSKNIIVQIVVTEQESIGDLAELMEYYYQHGINIKLFSDFNSDRQDYLSNKIGLLRQLFGRENVQTRFTGKQVNRGSACSGCDRKCITLKALWYFPNNASSTCPQGVKEIFNGNDWDSIVREAYEAHYYIKDKRNS